MANLQDNGDNEQRRQLYRSSESVEKQSHIPLSCRCKYKCTMYDTKLCSYLYMKSSIYSSKCTSTAGNIDIYPDRTAGIPKLTTSLRSRLLPGGVRHLPPTSTSIRRAIPGMNTELPPSDLQFWTFNRATGSSLDGGQIVRPQPPQSLYPAVRYRTGELATEGPDPHIPSVTVHTQVSTTHLCQTRS